MNGKEFLRNNFDLVFDKVGVFEKVKKNGSVDIRLFCDRAFYSKNIKDSGTMYVAWGDDDEIVRPYEIDSEDLTRDARGNISFENTDGMTVHIREFKEEDGQWASRWKMDMPVKALEYLNSPDLMEGDDMKEYLVAYSKEESSGPVFGVEYYNSKLGSFARANGTWILLSPSDETFIDVPATFIDPDKADEFLKAFDKGGLMIDEVDKKYARQEGE